MKRVKEKFKSVRVKLFFTLSVVIMLIICLLIVMNSLILEGFYMFSKINTVKKEYQKINDLYNSEDVAIFSSIKDDATANNFDIMIENEDYVLLFSTNEKFTNKINQDSDVISKFKIFDRQRDRILYSNDSYIIKKVTTGGFNSILLVGTLENQYKIYIQVPISAIEESVRISNNLLLILIFQRSLLSQYLNWMQ